MSDRESGAIKPAAPVTDPSEALPELAPMRAAAEAGDWAATRDFLGGLDSADDVSFAADALAGVTGAEEYLETAARALPDDPLPRTLLAERYIRVGWTIRGGAHAEYVSRDQFDQFHSWLRRAEQLLIEVCAEQPAYVPAWTARLLTARGLGLGQSEARRRYDRSAARHQHPFRAQLQFLQQLCPKWGGSLEEMHRFAGERMAAGPDGSPAGTLVAEAHVEHWLELSGVAGTEYLRDVSVRNSLRQAARVSALHPDHRPGRQQLIGHGTFALAFSLGGHLRDAAPHFAALGNTAGTSSWRYVGDWPSRFAAYRTAALATSGGETDR